MTYQFNYIPQTDVWHLAYSPHITTGYTDPEHDLPGVVPGGDWSLYGDVFGVSDGGAIGLRVVCEDGRAVSLLGAWNWPAGAELGEDTYLIQSPGTIRLRMRYWHLGNALELSVSSTGVEWQEVVTLAIPTPVDTGLLLRYADESLNYVEGLVTGVVLLPTTEELAGTTEVVLAPTGYTAPPVVQPLVTLGSEPTVYVMIGAPFGDLELDIGKTARWMEHFSDKLYVLDVNMGDPRYWIINWTLTFPDADHSVTSINYFTNPVGFRKEQFKRADALYHMPDDSWMVFIDGTEGLSFDNASLPNDYSSNPFMSFIYREITRAEVAGQTSVVLPLFVFLRSGDIQNVTYGPQTPGVPSVLQPISVPYYLPYQGLRRMFRTDVLRSSSFDWTSLDQPATPSPNVKAQIVSYAYAHWQPMDIPPGQQTIPPLSEANDDGFRMRKKISQVRPIASLPVQAWDPAADPAGVPGPWALYTLTNTHPNFDPITDDPVTAPAAAVLGVKTPLYDTVFRLNLRDGVWYEGAETVAGATVSGNTPLTWNPDTQQWMTLYDPTAWVDQGVDAPYNPAFVQPPTPV